MIITRLFVPPLNRALSYGDFEIQRCSFFNSASARNQYSWSRPSGLPSFSHKWYARSEMPPVRLSRFAAKRSPPKLAIADHSRFLCRVNLFCVSWQHVGRFRSGPHRLSGCGSFSPRDSIMLPVPAPSQRRHGIMRL
jgi:hypothetical protein